MPSPLVSVKVYTYNHEKYIAQCLEGILMQRTNFPFEVIVGEDCSTDRTREIVIAYQEKYPDKIKTIFHSVNIGAGQNDLAVTQACKGKYQALCEGDDYWIDPLKLQKQADFMESHPDVSLCFHNALVINEKHAATRLFFESSLGEILEFDEIYNVTLPTASLLFRSEMVAFLPEWRVNIWCGDLLLRLWCVHHGKFGYLDELMSVYRRLESGAVSQKQTQGHRAYFDDVYRTYQEFDIETGFTHTSLIKREIARLKEIQVRHRIHGRWYYLVKPNQIFIRLNQYIKWINRQKKVF
jgi:glycosyltransferase involved in cell wall biosynthesis